MGKTIPATGNCKCKGPEVEVCPQLKDQCREPCARAESARVTEGDEVRGETVARS